MYSFKLVKRFRGNEAKGLQVFPNAARVTTGLSLQTGLADRVGPRSSRGCGAKPLLAQLGAVAFRQGGDDGAVGRIDFIIGQRAIGKAIAD